MGIIYKITNKINGHIYIGQTIFSLEKRWREHENASYRENKEQNLPLHRAIRKYGSKNFTKEIIEECDNNTLNDKEIYWISFYNSYKNPQHYNASPGGQGNHGFIFDYQELAKAYKKYESLYKVSNLFGCSIETVRQACLRENVKILSCKEQNLKKAKKIECIELNLKFDSMNDAGRWLQENGYTTSYKSAVVCLCNYFKGKNKSVYGLHWNELDVY